MRVGLALDEHVIAARLAALEEYVRLLSDVSAVDVSEFVADPRIWGSAERFLQLAIEAVFDLGTHFIAGLELQRPTHYSDILPTLRNAGVISRETAGELESLAGFRNLLVHDYTRVDRRRVHALITSRITGLRKFAADIAVFLERRSND